MEQSYLLNGYCQMKSELKEQILFPIIHLGFLGKHQVYKDLDGNLITKLFKEQQNSEEFLKILGYENK